MTAYPPFKRRSAQDASGRDTLQDSAGVPVTPYLRDEIEAEAHAIGASEAEMNTPGFLEAVAHVRTLANLGWFESADETVSYLVSITAPLGIVWGNEP